MTGPTIRSQQRYLLLDVYSPDDSPVGRK